MGVLEQHAKASVARLRFQIQSLDRNSVVQLGVPRRREREKRIARRRLDFDDGRSGLSQTRNRKWAGKILRNRDDANSIKKTFHPVNYTLTDNEPSL